MSVTKDNLFQFRNGCGCLVLKLYGHLFGVSSITLRGNNGEVLAGKASIKMDPEGVPSVKMEDDAKTEVTLVCNGEHIVLGVTPEEATEFWFAIPPTTFENGFSIEVRGTKGEIVKKTMNKAVSQAHLNCCRISEADNYLEFDMTVTLYQETDGDIRIFYAGPITKD